MIVFVAKILFFCFLLVLPILYIKIRDEIKFRIGEHKWKKQSFIWNGWEINKDFYEVIDGKLVQKKQ